MISDGIAMARVFQINCSFLLLLKRDYWKPKELYRKIADVDHVRNVGKLDVNVRY